MGSASSKAAKSNPVQKLIKNSNGNNVRTFPKQRSRPPVDNLSRSEDLKSHHRTVGKKVDNVSFDTITRPRIDNDDLDVPLSKRLQQIGPVKPTPITFEIHPSSHLRSPNLQSSKQDSSRISNTNPLQVPVLNPAIKPNQKTTIDRVTATITPKPNAAITLLSARSRFANEAEVELSNVGKSGFKGRRFLDLETIRQVLVMRHANSEVSNEEIEQKLCLNRGVLDLLGKRGIVDIIE